MEDLEFHELKSTCYGLLADYERNSDNLYQFVSSGERPLAAFNEVCQSVESFECNAVDQVADMFEAKFKDSAANREIMCIGKFASLKDYFLKPLVKYANVLYISTFMDPDDRKKIIDCLAEDKRQKERKPEDFENEAFLHNGVLKSITTGASIFEQLSRVVENYKINKMTVYFSVQYPLELLFNLPNIEPREVDLIAADKLMFPQICEQDMLDIIGDNFLKIAKVTLQIDGFFGLYDEDSDFLVKTFDILEEKFPELQFIHVIYKRILKEFPATPEEIKALITAFEENVKVERKTRILVEWKMSYPKFKRHFLMMMKKTFGDYEYRSGEGVDAFGKCVELNPNLLFDVEVNGFADLPNVTEYFPKDRGPRQECSIS